MSRRPGVVVLVLALALSLVFAASAAAANIPGQYIVVLKDSVDGPATVAAKHSRQYNLAQGQVYRHALKGYAAAMSEATVERLRSDPRVRAVSPDGELRLAAKPPPCTEPAVCQVLSNAVNRIDGDLSSTRSGNGRGAVPLNVAVLDTGIDTDHPDLNVAGGKDCAAGEGFEDRDGHGTMVGGFVGALDNSVGRVGVAPGARLWAVRVARPGGFIADSWLICGLEFVAAANSDGDSTNDIAVANLSLAGPLKDEEPCATTKHALHIAVCGIIDRGVVPVAAAGNEGVDLATLQPAAWDEALTVTATADNDGQPGAAGGSFNCLTSETDDSAATFSNFATLAEDRSHVVAAPGVCIGSTFLDGQYAVSSGTSFATPLVAGAVVLCIYLAPARG